MDESIAAAAFILLIAAIFAYVLSLLLPRRHYPRFFALTIGLATVPLLAILKVPGASEAFYFLLLSAGITLWPVWPFMLEEVRNWFFKHPEVNNAVSTPSAPAPRLRSLVLGFLLGVIVGGSLVFAFTGSKETLDRNRHTPPGWRWERTPKSGLRASKSQMEQYILEYTPLPTTCPAM